MGIMENDIETVGEVLEQYRVGFATLDTQMLNQIWDQQYKKIVYIPMEATAVLRGWDDVQAYYRRIAKILDTQKMQLSDISIDTLGEMAHAFCRFHYEGKVNGREHMVDGRCTFVMHRKDGAWKVIHYHESQPGPIDLGADD